MNIIAKTTQNKQKPEWTNSTENKIDQKTWERKKRQKQ